MQRARLIDAVLARPHGEARPAACRLLPASLVLGSPAPRPRQRRPRGADRAASSTPTPATSPAPPTGEWVVLATRPTPPSATATCWPARVALSHGLAGLFRDCHTAARRAITSACRRASRRVPRDDGRIVVLSPGPEARPISATPTSRAISATPGRERRPHRPRQQALSQDAGRPAAGLSGRLQAARAPADPLHLPGSGMPAFPGWSRRRAAATSPWSIALGSGVLQNHALAPFAAACSAGCCGEAPLLAGRARRSGWATGEPPRGAGATPELGLRRSHRAQRSWRAVGPCWRRPRSPAARSGASGAGPAAEGHRWVAVEPVRLATTPIVRRERPGPQPRSRCAPMSWSPRTATGSCPAAWSAWPARPQPPPCPTASAARTCGSPRRTPELQQPSILRTTCRGASAPDRPRPAQPHRRQSVLARPLRASAPRRPCACCAACWRASSRTAAPTAIPSVLQRLLRLVLQQGRRLRRDSPTSRAGTAVEELVGVADVRASAPTACATASTSCTGRRRWSATRSATTRGACSAPAHRPALAPAAGGVASPGRRSSCSTRASARSTRSAAPKPRT